VADWLAHIRYAFRAGLSAYRHARAIHQRRKTIESPL
jgi:hypothetical protein